jgi:hypothetical protein
VLRWTWDEDINFEERWVRLGTRKNRSGEMVYEMKKGGSGSEHGKIDPVRWFTKSFG